LEEEMAGEECAEADAEVAEADENPEPEEE